jgi:hypothetical protein
MESKSATRVCVSLSKEKRLTILKKIWIYASLKEKANKHKNGQLRYVFEYLKLNLNKFVKQGDILLYCDKRRCEDTDGKKQNFKDNSRQVEKMRKDLYPLEWTEVSKNGELWFKYTPHLKDRISNEIIDKHGHKKDGFSKSTIKEELKSSNYKCCITGIPEENGGLAADHFMPKEKGGLSDSNNCIILNKILNEKKNKKMPIEWFCETLLTNFLNICKRVGILEECKQKMILFIQEFK